ncbi:MAG: YqiA/YcfP family alpha/beta fold hydrolase, partial [Limnohabitans sp.]
MPTPSNALKLPPHRWCWCDDDLVRLKDVVPTHLLYLHGFRSSPRSAKARCMADWVARPRPELPRPCPALPPSPAQALRAISAGL